MWKIRWYIWVILILSGIIVLLLLSRKNSSKGEGGTLKQTLIKELRDVLEVSSNPKGVLEEVMKPKEERRKGQRTSQRRVSPNEESLERSEAKWRRSRRTSQTSLERSEERGKSQQTSLERSKERGSDLHTIKFEIQASPRSPQEDFLNPTGFTPSPLEPKGFESRGEKKSRRILEKRFKMRFDRVRPGWLKNPTTGCSMELDGYCEKLKIAFEYQGIQHYRYPNKFHHSEEEFWAQRSRDDFKAEICKDLGIWLILIPYTVPFSQIETYIFERLPPRGHFKTLARSPVEEKIDLYA